MGKIGDVYYVVGLDAQGIPQLAKKEGEKAGKAFGTSMSGGIKKNLKGAFSGGQGQLMGALGIGAGVGIATVALTKLVDVMGDAVQAALEEEKSIAKLDAALRANVDGYDGNRDAIEKTLQSRMRLGFADDEQRDSLALLVAATKDYNKALKVQRVAMDLSRLKGISLKDASEALVKVEAGQFRILKSLGIQLPKNATATEALAAVQKVAAGQAEAFAETNEGKLLASQIRVGERLETLGAKVMPMFIGAVEGGADVVEAFAGALDALSGKFPETTEESIDFIETMLQFSPMKDLVMRSLGDVQDELDETARETFRSTNRITGSIDDLEGEYEELAESADKANRRMRDGIRDLEDAFVSSAKRIIADYYDPIEQRQELITLKKEATEQRQIVASKDSTKEQIADAKVRLREIQRQTTELLISLAVTGNATQKEISSAITTWSKKARTAKGQALADIRAIIRQLTLLKLAAQQASGALKLGGGIGTGSGGRAEGGPVSAGRLYEVNELPGQREFFVPDVNGTVYPDVQALGSAVGPTTKSAGNTYNVSVMAPTRPVSIREIGGDLRALGEMGYLPGRKG